MSTVEEQKMKRSLFFGAFLAASYDGKYVTAVFLTILLLLIGKHGFLLLLIGRYDICSAIIR